MGLRRFNGAGAGFGAGAGCGFGVGWGFGGGPIGPLNLGAGGGCGVGGKVPPPRALAHPPAPPAHPPPLPPHTLAPPSPPPASASGARGEERGGGCASLSAGVVCAGSHASRAPPASFLVVNAAVWSGGCRGGRWAPPSCAARWGGWAGSGGGRLAAACAPCMRGAGVTRQALTLHPPTHASQGQHLPAGGLLFQTHVGAQSGRRQALVSARTREVRGWRCAACAFAPTASRNCNANYGPTGS